MRYRSLSILCLAIMIVYLMRPLLPYVEYMVNRHYIETHLCLQKADPNNTCHGKCHLHEQLKKQSEPQDNDRNNGSKILTDKKIDDHLRGFITLPTLFGDDIILSSNYPEPGTVSVNSYVFVPPEL